MDVLGARDKFFYEKGRGVREQCWFPAPASSASRSVAGGSASARQFSSVGCLDFLDRSASCFPAELLHICRTLLQDGRLRRTKVLRREAASSPNASVYNIARAILSRGCYHARSPISHRKCGSAAQRLAANSAAYGCRPAYPLCCIGPPLGRTAGRRVGCPIRNRVDVPRSSEIAAGFRSYRISEDHGRLGQARPREHGDARPGQVTQACVDR